MPALHNSIKTQKVARHRVVRSSLGMVLDCMIGSVLLPQAFEAAVVEIDGVFHFGRKALRSTAKP